ncbi:MAG: hypothetical protein KJZ72_03765 [Anaerolineales bacterium]|jgi:hypothetical protein|nr:hypothetical protein [Anaerolineales bacterium]
MTSETNYREHQNEIKIVISTVLNEYEPEEIDLVDPLLEKYLKLIESGDYVQPSSSARKDIPLGFGGDSSLLIAILIPVVTSTFSKLLEYLTVDKLREARMDDKKKKAERDEGKMGFQTHIDKVNDEIVIKITGAGISKKQAKELASRIISLILQEMKKRS